MNVKRECSVIYFIIFHIPIGFVLQWICWYISFRALQECSCEWCADGFIIAKIYIKDRWVVTRTLNRNQLGLKACRLFTSLSLYLEARFRNYIIVTKKRSQWSFQLPFIMGWERLLQLDWYTMSQSTNIGKEMSQLRYLDLTVFNFTRLTSITFHDNLLKESGAW
jgi:hypothetical protein